MMQSIRIIHMILDSYCCISVIRVYWLNTPSAIYIDAALIMKM